MNPLEASQETDRPAPTGQRRTFLEVLDQVIKEKHPGLRSGLVVQEGCMVLFVINSAHTKRKSEIGCDPNPSDGWWFCWPDGERIRPVEHAGRVAHMIARHLQAEAGAQS